MKTWELKRTTQCKKCPWRKETDPLTIPHGYSIEKHRALISTIATPGDVSTLSEPLAIMGCHEEDETPCLGWLIQQLEDGNNIKLRLQMRACTNAESIRLIGEQHEKFEDTLPEYIQGDMNRE